MIFNVSHQSSLDQLLLASCLGLSESQVGRPREQQLRHVRRVDSNRCLCRCCRQRVQGLRRQLATTTLEDKVTQLSHRAA